MWTKPIELEKSFSDFHGLVNNHPEERDMFGVEIELEGRKITIPGRPATPFYRYWRGDPDGSLRRNTPEDEAIEYKFRQPLDMKRTEEAINILYEHLSKKDVTIAESGRTSVHVHVNCLNEPVAVVYNYITLALIFDELLVSQNGSHRIGNNFCLRARDAEGQLVNLTRLLKSQGSLRGLGQDYRYSSVNIVSLFKFGTIEFRSLECTIDRHRLLTWIKVLQALKTAARKYTNPSEIVNQFSAKGTERFVMETLGLHLALPYLKVPEYPQMIWNGVRLVQEFAHSSSWTPIIAKDREEKIRNKDLEYRKYVEMINAQQIALTGPAPPAPAPVPQPVGLWPAHANPFLNGANWLTPAVDDQL